jgi:hypothetical protein
MVSKRVPSDVVKAIFHYLGAGARFSANIPKIHESFYSICRMQDFEVLCREFIFDTSRVFPYCPTIGYALDRLQKADLLSCRNPGLDEYEVSDVLAGKEAGIEALFSEGEQFLLEKAARVFKEKTNG